MVDDEVDLPTKPLAGQLAGGLVVATPAQVVATRDTVDLRREIKRCAECGQQFSPDGMFCPFDGSKLVESKWDPSKDPLIGQTIDGRYEVRGVEGEGGMGTVYEVRHKTLARSFAMKVLRRDVARDPELATRFVLEARATAAIKHPHIVQITDFGKLDDGTPYFVMELLVGETLSQIIKRGGPLPAARAAKIVLQVAGALGAAHEAGVVHRDMKPENVFLVRPAAGAAGNEDDVRVVDFGTAKVAGAGRLTKTGIVFGTPHYMSPEQASGQPVDHRADIYALGIIMYEMFTGRVPFEADTYMGVLTQHMFAEPIPPSRLVRDAGELGALEDVILRALEKKPEMRYQTMQALAADVQKVVRFAPDGVADVAPRLEAPPRRARTPLFPMADRLEVPGRQELRRTLFGEGDATRRLVLISSVALGTVGIAAYFALRPHAEVSAARAPAATMLAAPPPIQAPVPPPPLPAEPQVTSVRLTSTPSAAEVWSRGMQVGTTPMDLAVEGAAPVRYVVRAQGYADREILVDPTQTAQHADLRRLAPPPRPRDTQPVGSKPAPPRSSPTGDLQDPWATK
jgi:tRNA A-37 threonylcarbamoyl transferase component Bud32